MTVRLIDADALLNRMTKAMESGSNLNGTFHLYIEHAPTIQRPTWEWIPVSDIRKLEDVVYMHIDSLEGTRNIVEAGMLSAWKEVAEYVDGMLGEDGEA